MQKKRTNRIAKVTISVSDISVSDKINTKLQIIEVNGWAHPMTKGTKPGSQKPYKAILFFIKS